MIMPRGTKSAFTSAQTLRHNIGKPDKRAAADKQNVTSVDLHRLHLTMLTRALHRHGCHSTFQNLQQSLLHALTAHIAGDGGVLTPLLRAILSISSI